MTIKDSFSSNKKNVKFDSDNILDAEIAMLTEMMTKLNTQNIRQSKPLKPKIY